MRLYLSLLLCAALTIAAIVNGKYFFAEKAVRQFNEQGLIYSEALNRYIYNVIQSEKASLSNNHQNNASADAQAGEPDYNFCLFPSISALAQAAEALSPPVFLGNPTSLKTLLSQCQQQPQNNILHQNIKLLALAQQSKTQRLLTDSLKSSEQRTHKLHLANRLCFSLILILAGFLFYRWLKDRTNMNRSLLQQLTKNQREFSRSQNIMLSMMEDTREQTQRAIELANLNQQLAVIVQKSQTATLLLHKDGTITQANHSAQSMFALSDSNTTSELTLEDLPATITAFINFAMAAMSKDSPPENKIIAISKFDEPDTEIQLNCILYPLPSARNHELDFAFTANDITHLHQIQDNLRKIIEQAPNALIMTDTKGVIVMSNGAASHLFGYAEQELNGKPVEALIPSESRKSHPALRQSFVKHPQARTMGKGRDLTAIKKSGEEFPVEIGLNPLTTTEGLFVIASVVDLTERLKTQKHLEFVNTELQQRNFEMEQFIYTVSHDLKAPLVTIAGFSERLHSALEPHFTDKQKHQAERIQANILQMEQLLNDLVELSRVIKQDIVKAQLDTEKVINNVLMSLENDIELSQATISISQPLHSIYANERLLAQCLQNLIANAIKYRDPSRPLKVLVSTEQKDHETLLFVGDNGLGIDPKYHEKIFKIFERLNAGEGTGIGLTIVRTVVEKHNGHIYLKSTPGEGSTFILHFPIKMGIGVVDE